MKRKRILHFRKYLKETSLTTYKTISDTSIVNFFYKEQEKYNCEILEIDLDDILLSTIIIKATKKVFNNIILDFVNEFGQYISGISK